MDFQSLLDYGANLTFYLGIIFIIVAAVIYVRKRLSDLESKQNSMFDILGALAREVQSIKNGDGGIIVQDNNMPIAGEQLDDYMRMETQYTDLIEESDDDEESDENDEDNEDNEQEDSDLTEEDEQEQDKDEEDDEDEGDDEDEDDDEEEDDDEDDDNNEGEKDVVEKEEDNVKVLEVEELPSESEEPYPEAQEDGVKHVEITESEIIDSELNDVHELSSETDYEKMTTKELKTLVSQKGLAAEVGKMKRLSLIHISEPTRPY